MRWLATLLLAAAACGAPQIGPSLGETVVTSSGSPFARLGGGEEVLSVHNPSTFAERVRVFCPGSLGGGGSHATLCVPPRSSVRLLVEVNYRDQGASACRVEGFSLSASCRE